MTHLPIRTFIDSVRERIVVIDQKYRIIFANKSFCDNIEIPFDIVIGNYCHALIRHKQRPCAETDSSCVVNRVFATGFAGNCDCCCFSPHAPAVYANGTTHPLQQDLADKRFALIVCTLENEKKENFDAEIPVVKDMQNISAREQKSRRLLHDFNDILSPIISYSDILESELSVSSPLRKYVTGISKSAQRAMDFVKKFQVHQAIDGKPGRLSSRGERILFVDDDYLIATAGKRLMEKFGYQVDMKICSFEALKVFKQAPKSYDLAILDLKMPNMDGDMLAQELIKVRADIPIIICTGLDEMTTEKTKSIGITDIINKPITSIELSAKIQNAIGMNNMKRNSGASDRRLEY
jgi:CheY-like chemotaxis protein